MTPTNSLNVGTGKTSFVCEIPIGWTHRLVVREDESAYVIITHPIHRPKMFADGKWSSLNFVPYDDQGIL